MKGWHAWRATKHIKLSTVEKAQRRDYSKVSGKLELPNLVEIQTDSFEWFTKEGVQEVFNEIYPIENYGKNIKLNFLRYRFDKPKYNKEESMYRECNYAAPLYADMELEVTDSTSGEIITKTEEVYLGDFPLMTETGTFIINGAERVIVSQIVRSPGAYFSQSEDEKSGKQNYECELIPSRGTWLEFMTEQKKTTNGRLINVSIDRRRKILFSILFKAIGMSFNLGDLEDTKDTSDLECFLTAMGRDFPGKPDRALLEKRDHYQSEKDALTKEKEALVKKQRDGKAKDVGIIEKIAATDAELETVESNLAKVEAELADFLAYDLEDRDYMNLYLLLYTSFFGKYEDVENALLNDYTKDSRSADNTSTTQGALLNFYGNQRSDEVAVVSASVSLMYAKFFDHRRYDLTKAGRYKLRKN